MVHSIACRQAQVSARLEDLHEVFPLIPILSIKDFQEETAYIYIYTVFANTMGERLSY